MPALRKARALRPGDVIGIAAPASPIEPEELEAGETLIRDLGFEPRRGPDLTARRGYLAGEDAARAAQLRTLVADPDVRAIWCARGGYGSQRILSQLDAAAFRKAAKPLIGYSDITVLLLWLRRRAGLMGLHGAMFEGASAGVSESHRALGRALAGVGELIRLPGRLLFAPRTVAWGEGRLTGGSLSLVAASLGTPWEIDTRDSILLLEDVHERPYRIDRMLQQLVAAGKFDGVQGVGFGKLVGCEDADAAATPVEEVLREILEPLGMPTLVDLPFGHGETNLPWPHGARAAIDANRCEIEVLEFGVARR